MNVNNETNNKNVNDLIKKEQEEKIDFVSFSEMNKDGKFIETYGYFKKNALDSTLDERVDEIARRLGKK